MLACGPDCGCGAAPLVTRPTTLGEFGFVAEIAAAAQAAAAVIGAADAAGIGKKKKRPEPIVQAPARVGLLDSFGAQYRPMVLAGLVGLGGLVLVKVMKG